MTTHRDREEASAADSSRIIEMRSRSHARSSRKRYRDQMETRHISRVIRAATSAASTSTAASSSSPSSMSRQRRVFGLVDMWRQRQRCDASYLEELMAQDNSSDSSSVTFDTEQVELPIASRISLQSIPPMSTGITFPPEIYEHILKYADIGDMVSASMVSRGFHEITQSTNFRSQIILSNCMPCEAIYEAFRHPRIFSAELVRHLLDNGAILSRYFVELFCRSYYSMADLTSHDIFASLAERGEMTEVYNVILNEGTRLYGSNLRVDSSSSFPLILEHLREMLKSKGDTRNSFPNTDRSLEVQILQDKFADFCSKRLGTEARGLMFAMIKLDPSLVKAFQANGYVFDTATQIIICKSIITDEKSYTDVIREKLIYLLTEHDWKLTTGSLLSSINGNSQYFQNGQVPVIIPMENSEREAYKKNQGMGPVQESILVMKKLYDEGRAFQDLDEILPSLVDKAMEERLNNDIRGKWECLVRLRSMYCGFPTLMEESRLKIAALFTFYWQEKISSIPPFDVGTTVRALIEVLKMFDISKEELVDLLFDISADETKETIRNALDRGKSYQINFKTIKVDPKVESHKGKAGLKQLTEETFSRLMGLDGRGMEGENYFANAFNRIHSST